MTAEDRLAELGIELPTPNPPLAAYVPAVVTGNLVYVSGQIALEDGQPMWTGHVEEDVSIEEAQQAARRCAIQAIGVLNSRSGVPLPGRPIARPGWKIGAPWASMH